MFKLFLYSLAFALFNPLQIIDDIVESRNFEEQFLNLYSMFICQDLYLLAPCSFQKWIPSLLAVFDILLIEFWHVQRSLDPPLALLQYVLSFILTEVEGSFMWCPLIINRQKLSHTRFVGGDHLAFEWRERSAKFFRGGLVGGGLMCCHCVTF